MEPGKYTCAKCDDHLGHVFANEPAPDSLRYRALVQRDSFQVNTTTPEQYA
ncbi:peptide-methionine (R)-S-oxide reductase [Hymenobacter terrenus]|uniref:peptide-methionine (R)-S-oxide reductase n=1 Tax=Hymenobacter terrenus TaxID=1629124 RepID=UPI000A4ACFC4